MKPSIFLFLILASYFSFAQKHQIFDSESKKPIPYVNIKINGQFKYSDEKGRFTIEENKNDSIFLVSMGYKNFAMKISELKDSVFLKPEPQQLQEVIVHNTKPTIKKVGKSGNRLTWYINPDIQLGSLIKPREKFAGSYIRKIWVPISKSTLINLNSSPKRIKPDFHSIFKIHLFSNKSGLPGNALLLEPIVISCTENSPNEIDVDISENHIRFPREGIFICIEMIGEIDGNGNVRNKMNPMPGFEFTGRKTKHFLSKSFYKSKFSENWEVMDQEEFHIPKEMFLAVHLELAVY